MPGTQSKHKAFPFAELYVPFLQSLQLCDAGAADASPGSHRIHVEELDAPMVVLAFPGLQSLQMSSDTAPVAVEYFPAPHF